jgi:hypothetical protein
LFNAGEETSLHARITQPEPVLHKVDAQHHFQRVGLPTMAGLRVDRSDLSGQRLPGNDLIHFFKEQLAARLLSLARVLGITETHLAHRLALLSADGSMKSHFV